MLGSGVDLGGRLGSIGSWHVVEHALEAGRATGSESVAADKRRCGKGAAHWSTSSEKTPAGIPRVGEKTIPTCDAKQRRSGLCSFDSSPGRPTYISECHLVGCSVLDNQDQVGGEGTEKTVVGKRKLSDEMAKFADPLLGLDKVWDKRG